MLPKVIIGILALALIGTVVGLAVVYQNIQASQSSLSLTRAELETARETLDNYEELNRSLAAANEELIAKIQEQAGQNHRLEATNSDLVAESRRIYQEVQRVEELNTSLDQEVREATARNNSLNRENHNLSTRNGQIEADNNFLNRELEIAGENARTLQEQNDRQSLNIQTLELDKTELTANVNELEGRNLLLGQQNDRQASAIQTLEQEKTELTADVTELQDRNRELSQQNDTLRNKSGSVQRLNTQIDSLRAEIRRLEERRKPLSVESFPAYFRCTGSMEPKITCLDSATMLENFLPHDIRVGTVISFRPTAACELTGSSRVLHRVMKIKVERGTYYYWPKGDNNSGPDECWIPESNVYGYVIELHKNTHPENAKLRNSVNAADAVADKARDAYYSRRASYGCYDPDRVCTVSPGKYRELNRLYSEYRDAYNYLRCWVDTARNAWYSSFGPPLYTPCTK